MKRRFSLRLRMALSAGLLLAILAGVSAVFWQQELQYSLPTPVPEGYQPIAPGTPVRLAALGLKREQPTGQPHLLHFFSPECPCSRFHLRRFANLVADYHAVVNIAVVVAEPDLVAPTQRLLNQRLADLALPIPVLLDSGQRLAQAAGVYATPQALITDAEGSLYYRGNYNRSRYCTDPGTRFAKQALDSLQAGRPAPNFDNLATTAYGCEWPLDDIPVCQPSSKP